MKRREFFTAAAAASALVGAPRGYGAAGESIGAKQPTNPQRRRVTIAELDAALAAPVLKAELFPSPVKIASVELLRNGNEFVVRATSADGAVGIAVSSGDRMRYLYPILVQQVAPYFIGRDARQLDALIDGVYVHQSNYKMQGLAFWVCVASVEFAILDLLGQLAGKPVGAILGDIVRNEVAVYRASGNRGNTPEEEVDVLVRLVEQTGATAVKFKVGGRMSNNADSLPGRSEALIPLVRKALGDEMTIYADSNGSYDPPKAIEIGRLLESIDAGFFEEPCPFDHLEDTKRVADALTIPLAGGEQESSLRRFRWMIHNDCVQVVQPDLFYFGGFVRSIRVARMAALAGMPCTPHMSGSGLGFLYVLHFASCVADVGPHQEYKGAPRIPFVCETSSLVSENGKVRVPTGPGLGVTLDPGFLRKSQVVSGY
jgi:L-alanine-DL-glutamate epimerase-like enolase superfamily enzyme